MVKAGAATDCRKQATAALMAGQYNEYNTAPLLGLLSCNDHGGSAFTGGFCCRTSRVCEPEHMNRYIPSWVRRGCMDKGFISKVFQDYNVSFIGDTASCKKRQVQNNVMHSLPVLVAMHYSIKPIHDM
jgi:hypothetical protein